MRTENKNFDLEDTLTKSLEELNNAAQRIVNTRDYTREILKLQKLGNLVREQLLKEGRIAGKKDHTF